jgi:hypothetical protein
MKFLTILAMGVALAAPIVAAPSLGVAATPPGAKTLQAEIQAKGAKAVVAELRAGPSPQWEPVLNKISLGGADWLALAGDLLSGTDAATTQGVFGALSEALSNNPRAILAMLGPDAGVADVCIDRQIEPTPARRQAFIARTRAALLTVKAEGLRPKRDACLAKMGSE